MPRNSFAQFNPGNKANKTGMNLFNQADTTKVDSMSKGWQDVNAKIYFTTLSSEVQRHPDTSIHHFQHYEPTYPWWGIDLGNFGTATRSVFFRPLNNKPGLSSGYHVFDFYKINLDSLKFYNTTNPYSDFTFILGSKNQQIASLTHTQNINPNWNFAANLKASSSEGFFARQKAKGFSGSLNTNYISDNERYKVKAAFIYNRFSEDENGGILSDSFLTLDNFNDRSRIPTNIPPLNQTRDQSPVNNIFRDLSFYIQNNYAWGQKDTSYNKDSTKRNITFTPRFSLQHEFRFYSQKHQFNDYRPDSARYAFLIPLNFNPKDSVKGRQSWQYISNRFSLNGFLGKNQHLLKAKAGIGNRIDLFSTLIPSEQRHDNSFNTFLFAQIEKEAFAPNQWYYNASAQFYLTGQALGDFNINLNLNKQLNEWIGFKLGFHQSLSEAPKIFKNFSNNFFDFNYDLNKTGITHLNADLIIPKLKIKIATNYYLISNYLYFNEKLKPQQEKSLQSIFQIYGFKQLAFYKFTLDNHIVFQQNQNNSPINLPTFMIQEQLAFQSDVFKGALHIATGIEFKYTTPYYSYGYSPYLNHFFSQNRYQINNTPQLNAFFNFQLHHFRAFVSLSQIQQLLYQNIINAPGYPAENMIFRFGFSWILIN